MADAAAATKAAKDKTTKQGGPPKAPQSPVDVVDEQAADDALGEVLDKVAGSLYRHQMSMWGKNEADMKRFEDLSKTDKYQWRYEAGKMVAAFGALTQIDFKTIQIAVRRLLKEPEPKSED